MDGWMDGRYSIDREKMHARFLLGKCALKNGCENIYIFLSTFFYLPTDAQLNCLKNNFKIYIKIDIKTAPTYFGVITIIRGRTIRSC
jgi:hypothetical protein